MPDISCWSSGVPWGARDNMMATPLRFRQVRSGFECQSHNQNLGNQPTVSRCAFACANELGCRFFIYGTGWRDEQCIMEGTASADCTEGWAEGQYDFYELYDSPPAPISAVESTPIPSVSAANCSSKGSPPAAATITNWV